VEHELRIRTALLRLGIDDVLRWAEKNCAASLVDLNEQLAAGVAPVDLEQFMATAARDSGRYEEFVRMQAVRRLSEQFPEGFGASNQQGYGLAAGWAMWSSLFELAQQKSAHAVWDRLAETMRMRPEWRPSTPTDPLIVAAFSDTSFQPSDEQRRFNEAVRVMERLARRGNRRRSYVKAIENLRRASPGYGLLYALHSIDGQVCNGGFIQFYQNTGGAPAMLAVDAFRAINHGEVADLVEESLQAATRDCPDLLTPAVAAAAHEVPVQARRRSLEELDEHYFALSRAEGSDWLECSMIGLVTSRPDLFSDRDRNE